MIIIWSWWRCVTTRSSSLTGVHIRMNSPLISKLIVIMCTNAIRVTLTEAHVLCKQPNHQNYTASSPSPSYHHIIPPHYLVTWLAIFHHHFALCVLHFWPNSVYVLSLFEVSICTANLKHPNLFPTTRHIYTTHKTPVRHAMRTYSLRTCFSFILSIYISLPLDAIVYSKRIQCFLLMYKTESFALARCPA